MEPTVHRTEIGEINVVTEPRVHCTEIGDIFGIDRSTQIQETKVVGWLPRRIVAVVVPCPYRYRGRQPGQEAGTLPERPGRGTHMGHRHRATGTAPFPESSSCLCFRAARVPPVPDSRAPAPGEAAAAGRAPPARDASRLRGHASQTRRNHGTEPHRSSRSRTD